MAMTRRQSMPMYPELYWKALDLVQVHCLLRTRERTVSGKARGGGQCQQRPRWLHSISFASIDAVLGSDCIAVAKGGGPMLREVVVCSLVAPHSTDAAHRKGTAASQAIRPRPSSPACTSDLVGV